jgi:hypothetical protein
MAQSRMSFGLQHVPEARAVRVMPDGRVPVYCEPAGIRV